MLWIPPWQHNGLVPPVRRPLGVGTNIFLRQGRLGRLRPGPLPVAPGLDGDQVRAKTDLLDLRAFFDGDRRVPFCCRRLAKLRNLFRRLGVHPGDKCLEHFGDVLKRYAGDLDLTFFQLSSSCTSGRAASCASP